MANNTVLNSGSGGDTIRDIDRSGVKTPVCVIDVGGTAGEALMGDGSNAMAIKALAGLLATAPLPVRLSDGTNFLTTTSTLAVAGDVAAGATDSGNPVKVGGVYKTSPATLTDGQRGNLTLTNDGSLRVNASVSPPADLTPATQNVTVVDSGSATGSGMNGQSIVTGTATASSFASFAVSGDSSYAIQVSGTWTGTLSFEQSIDAGVTWSPSGLFSAGTSSTGSTTTLNGTFHGNSSCVTNVRVRATAAVTGTAVVRLVASPSASVVKVLSSNADVVGKVFVGGILTDVIDVPVNVSASGDTQLVASTAGKKITVLHWYLQAGGGANNVKVQNFDGTTHTDLLPLQTLLASQTIAGAYQPIGQFRTAAGSSLTINLSAATQVTGILQYVLV